jgi:sulfatase maturation enzyme AslB (radical SAM superfamily)
MQIELTNQCNFKCVYCPHSVYGEEAGPSGNAFDRPKGYMSQETWANAIDVANRYAKNLTIGFFGEQLLHPQFQRFIFSIPHRRKRKYQTILNTNWALATEEHADVLKRFDLIRISLDSANPEKWDALCPGGPILQADGKKGQGSRFSVLAEKVRWWMKRTDRPPTNLIFVTQEENKAEVAAFVQEWRAVLGRNDKINAKSILTYGGVMFDPYMEENHCKVASENRFTVAWDGRCTPCNLDVNLAMAVLNLNTHTVEEILDSPEWAATLAGIRAKQGICANCFDAQNHSQNFYGRTGKVVKNRTIPGKGEPV